MNGWDALFRMGELEGRRALVHLVVVHVLYSEIHVTHGLARNIEKVDFTRIG